MIRKIIQLFHNLIEKGMSPDDETQKSKPDPEISFADALVKHGQAQKDKPEVQTLDRKTFEKTVNESLDKGEETGCLLVCDVDRLREINDIYGCDSGDSVLVYVADVLHRVLGDGIRFSRFDSDMFVLWLSDASQDNVSDIRRKVGIVNDRLLHPAGELPPVSVSVGAAFYKIDDDCASLVKRAGKALYHVKANGRCGFEVWQ